MTCTRCYSRSILVAVTALAVLSGCLGTPNRATTPVRKDDGGKGGDAGGAAIAASSGATAVVSAPPGASAPPIAALASPNAGPIATPVPPPVISQNGANSIHGTVRIPASILSHNGGNVLSNNGSSVIANNGAGLEIREVPLAYATVKLMDGAGNAVKDDKGVEITTKTDADGKYTFPESVTGRNLVVHAVVTGHDDDLVAFLPGDAAAQQGGVDVDIASTMTMTYVLDAYVKNDLPTFERLKKDLVDGAARATVGAIAANSTLLPATTARSDLFSKIQQIRVDDASADKAFQAIHDALVVAGIVNEGDGSIATSVYLGKLGGAYFAGKDRGYVFSQGRHTLWRLDAQGILHTVVPEGKWPYPESSVMSLSSPMYVSGICVDARGFVYVADTYNNRIARISPAGEVLDFCGTGDQGYAGDNGPATLANISRPTGLVIDSDGNIVFCDAGNHCVRRIDSSGIITTLVGDGKSGSDLDASIQGGGRFVLPQDLFLDNKMLVICDTGSHRVVFEDIGTNRLSKVFQNSTLMDSPISAVVLGGTLYVMDSFRNKILSTPADGATDFSDGGAVTGLPSFGASSFIKLHDGQIDFDGGGGVIYHGDPVRGFVQIFGKVSSGKDNELRGAQGLAIAPDDTLYISDTSGNKIYELVPGGELETVAGVGIDDDWRLPSSARNSLESANALTAAVLTPRGIAVDPKSGDILFSTDEPHCTLRRLTRDGQIKLVLDWNNAKYADDITAGLLKPGLSSMYQFLCLDDGRVVFPTEFGPCLALPDGTVEMMPGYFTMPRAAAMFLDEKARICAVSQFSRQIRRFNGSAFEPVLDESTLQGHFDLSKFQAATMDRRGNLFLANEAQIVEITPDGSFRGIAGSNGAFYNGSTEDNRLENVLGLVISSNGDLMILDHYQIKKIRADQLGS